MRTLFTLALLTIFTLSLQAQNWRNRVQGKGEVISRDFDIASFEKITQSTSGKLIITQGSPQKVRIEGQANILDLIKTEVNDKHWKVGFKENVGNHKEVIVYVTVPKLSSVKLSGSGEVRSTNQLNQADEFNMYLSGSGDVDLDVQAATLTTGISGSGNIDLKGSADNFTMKISGSGDLDAYGLEVENAEIHISGSGDCEVHVTENLQAKVSGSGDIYYKGKPRVQAKVSGSGDIESRGSGSK